MGSASELVAQIKEGEKQVELASALKRLGHNRDFNLVTDRIFKDEAKSLMQSLSLQDVGSVGYNNVVRRMDAISYLEQLLNTFANSGDIARESVQQARRYLGDNFED